MGCSQVLSNSAHLKRGWGQRPLCRRDAGVAANVYPLLPAFMPAQTYPAVWRSEPALVSLQVRALKHPVKSSIRLIATSAVVPHSMPSP